MQKHNNNDPAIIALIIMIPLTIFMAWYSNNADRALRNYARQEYIRCLTQVDNSIVTVCEKINPEAFE